MVLEKTLESPFDCKEVKPANSKVNQPWIFSGKYIAEVEASVLGDLTQRVTHWKRPCSMKDWRQEEEEATEGKMVRWHHKLNGHEFEKVPLDSEGQGSLSWWSPWGWRVRPDLATEHQQQNIPFYICATSSFSIPLLIEI